MTLAPFWIVSPCAFVIVFYALVRWIGIFKFLGSVSNLERLAWIDLVNQTTRVFRSNKDWKDQIIRYQRIDIFIKVLGR